MKAEKKKKRAARVCPDPLRMNQAWYLIQQPNAKQL